MQRVSFGIIVNYLVAYLLQPYEKSKIAKAYEQSKISKDVFKQLQGITNQRTKKKILIWLHAESLTQADNFNEIISYFEDKKDVGFLLTTEERHIKQQFHMPGIYQCLPLDHPTFVRQFIDHWKPNSLVWLSDRIRPILLHRVAKSNILSLIHI